MSKSTAARVRSPVSGPDAATRHARFQPKETETPMGELAVGIDLGTTYSAIAWLDDLGRPQTLNNAEGDKLTPSAVLFEGDHFVVGKEAIKALATEAEDVAQCAKRRMGNRYFDRPLGGRQYPPEAIQACILNKLRVDASRQIGPVTQAVVTVPAYFDETRRKATQDAGYIAGLDVLDIINEPTAAAIAYGVLTAAKRGEATVKPQHVLVYDLGGGTFDVTVLRIEASCFIALATDGDVALGGHDWDQRLMEMVAERFRDEHDLDPRIDPNTVGRLWRECEDAKRTLSARQKTTVVCDYQGRTSKLELSRQQFEERTADLLERTRFTVSETIRASGLEAAEIDHVLLVGGSTRMPAVTQMLRELTGQEPDVSISPDEAVAHGAALRAGFILADRSGGQAPYLVRDINSHSLGVVGSESLTGRQRAAIVIPRNTPLPVTCHRVFVTQAPNQRSILVPVVEGESPNPDDCAWVGQVVVRDLPEGLPPRTPVQVRFTYLTNGRLAVDVHVEGVDVAVSHEIIREHAMTQEQLDRWRQHVSKVP